jgi:WD40 repeat protein
MQTNQAERTDSLSLTLVKTLEGHSDRVWHLAWSPSGNLLASCSGDKTIHLWGKDRGQGGGGGQQGEWVCKAILEDAHNRTVRRVAWSPCGRFLASASFDATTSIWENQSGDFECIATLEGHENEVKGLAWDSSGGLLATSSRDKSVWIWEMESDKEFECISVLHGHTQDVKSVTWHPSREMLASCSYDDTVKLWLEDEDDWYCHQTLTGHASTVWELAFDQTGEKIASCSDDKTIIIWKNFPEEGKPRYRNVCTLTGYHKRCIYSVHWSGQGLLASASADDTIRIFSKDNSIGGGGMGGERAESYGMACVKEKAHTADVNCVRWNPTDPTLLASCGDDNLVKIWKIQ